MRGFIGGFEQMTNTATKMSSLRYFVRLDLPPLAGSRAVKGDSFWR